MARTFVEERPCYATEEKSRYAVRDSPRVRERPPAVAVPTTPEERRTATYEASEARDATKTFAASWPASGQAGRWSDPMWQNAMSERQIRDAARRARESCQEQASLRQAQPMRHSQERVATKLFCSSSDSTLGHMRRSRSVSPTRLERTARHGPTASYRSTSPRFGSAVEHAMLGAKANENPKLQESLHRQPGVGEYEHARRDHRGHEWLTPELRQASRESGVHLGWH